MGIFSKVFKGIKKVAKKIGKGIKKIGKKLFGNKYKTMKYITDAMPAEVYEELKNRGFQKKITQTMKVDTDFVSELYWGKNNGTAYIQTSQSQMYQRNEFDTTYHEHISFFSANSMKTLAERAGLVLTDIHITPIHGDSYVFVLKHQGADVQSSVTETIRKEGKEGRHNPNFYQMFGINARSIVEKLKDIVTRCQAEGTPVVGYGAAAKGMTVLNANDIQLDWIVDDNELKQGLLTPGTNIPIKDRTSLDIDQHIVVIPLAWNFFDEIRANIQEVRQDKPTQYVQYFPTVMFVV